MELFGLRRFAEQASAFGLKPGFVVDLCEQKPYGPQKGQHWDLSLDSDVKELGKMIEYEDPWLITGFPPKGPYKAVRHLHTNIHFYRRQMKRGRYFLHEHPLGAGSFKDPQMIELMNEPGVMVVDGPMWRWDLRELCPRQGEGLAYKRTRWVTNCPALARTLQSECSNKGGGPVHRHFHLQGGMATQAAEYPPKLVQAVLKALREQLQADGELNAVDLGFGGPVP